MKKIKTISTRILFYLLALQILNLSIDVDYAEYVDHGDCVTAMSGFDDVDSYTEYIIEKFADDDNYTSETDDDSDRDQNRSVEKTESTFLYFEHFTKPGISSLVLDSKPTSPCLYLINKACKGFSTITGPPPKA